MTKLIRIMLCNCGSCLGAIRPDTASVACSGVCGKNFHIDCVGISDVALETLVSVPGFSWSCTICSRKCFSVDMDEFNRILKVKYSELIDNLNGVFSDLKNDFLKVAENKLSSEKLSVSEKKPTYSDIMMNKTNPAIIIKPKDKEQNVQETKSVISTSINPVDVNVQISKVRKTKDGGVLIGCSSSDETARFKKIAVEKLSENYEIKEVKGILPRVKIVGLTRNFSVNDLTELIEYVVKTNSNLFNLNSICKVIKVYPTKSNGKIFQAVLELDRTTYENLIKADFLLVGYDYCQIYDAHEIKRCFRCSEFNHSAKYCKKNRACPKCSEDHDLKDCSSETLCCMNCVKLEKSQNVSMDKNHAVWDPRCPVYKSAMDTLKQNILAIT
mgnify:CR=1 FL=1